MKDEVILAIETSCDETAIALLRNGKELLANSVNTQIEDHRRFGGVYPELASRLHLENIDQVLSYVLSLKGFDPRSITHVAVTGGPGLPGALQIGAMAAKTVASYFGVPLIDVHHLAGHIYANEFAGEFRYPLLAIVVSGGNSELVYLPRPFEFHILGETEDDAIGEALDKVARALSLPYPGGVSIDRMTKDDETIETFDLPRPKVDGYNLSYSGLKSHLLRLIQKEKAEAGGTLPPQRVKEIALSTEKAFVEQLLDKAELIKGDYDLRMVVVGGGVSANSYLRKRIRERLKGVDILIPPLWCTTDNAAMIAMAGHHMIEKNLLSPLSFRTRPNRNLEEEGREKGE